jgi:hypothetical protein
MKRAHFSVCGILPLACLLIVSACKPTDVPHAAPSSHAWAAEPVLVSLFTAANNTRTIDYEWSQLPDLVLYADGRLLVTRTDAKRDIYEAHLQPAEVCALLQQIATDGFLAIRPEDYAPVQYADFHTIWISINAWQGNEISAYGLDSVLKDDATAKRVPPALKATYLGLRDYMTSDLHVFQPEKVVVSVLALD